MASAARIDWPALVRFKRSIIGLVPREREARFAALGIDLVRGQARFTGPTTVAVDEERIEARYVHTATGATPAPLALPGREQLTTSEQFLELDHLPGRIVFVGGGYISFEFAHVAARAGAQVTILHRRSRPLGRSDPDLVGRLVERTRQIGVNVELDTEVSSIERAGAKMVVRATARGALCASETDLVVHGAGRVPDIDDLDLDRAEIAWDARRGVLVNEYLQSRSNPHVYAAGDAAAIGGPPLTPVAGYEARIVAGDVLEGNRYTADYTVVPSVVFTVPPLAAVGLSEAIARTEGRRVRGVYADTAGWYSARRLAEPCAAHKVLVDEETDTILGAHVLGPMADETINLFALAMKAGLTTRQVKDVLYAYPTHASDIPSML